jgi:dTDP-4-dehydrorhamnose reductase
MRLLITGLGGTLAPVLAAAALARGHAVLRWDRQALGFEPGGAFRQLQPDAVAHLGLSDAAGSRQLAGLAAEAGLPFLFTSTAMVFDHAPDGPHHPADPRTARDDYGRLKIASEDAVLAECPSASVVRLGWQIGDTATGNTMLAALDRWQAEQGEVALSRGWRPACSHLHDTAAALLDLLAHPGIHHLDANADEGWTMAEIGAALQRQHGRTHWRLRVHEDYRHDQRLKGGPVVPPLSARLPLQRA